MAFDKTQPTDTTKIRNLGVVIRPNWVAIEEGDSTFRPQAINLQNRTPLAASNDPATIADTSIFYVKDDGAGNPETYNKDGSGNIMQFTEGGRIGGPSTNFKMNTVRFGSGTVNYGINNIVTAYVRWNSAGSQLAAFGCTVSKISTGFYNVALTTARTNTQYVPVACAFDEGNSRCAKVNVLNTTTFTVSIVNDSGTRRDCGGFCHVVGGF